MIDWYAHVFTVDGDRVWPKPPYWPNPVSMEYCGVIKRAGRDYECWWTSEGWPLDGAPAIRN